MKHTPLRYYRSKYSPFAAVFALAACVQLPHQNTSYPSHIPPPPPPPVVAPVPVAPVPYLAAGAQTRIVNSVGQKIQLRVKDRSSGQFLPIYLHQGTYYVAGKPNAAYALQLHSTQAKGRLLTVVSVDGVNAITGETASTTQRGYVLTPLSQYDITGWRKSDTQVATFNFSPPSASYAAQTNRPNNLGIIGLAVFQELVLPPPPPVVIAPPISVDPRTGKTQANKQADAAPSKSMPGAPAPTAVAPVTRAVTPGLGTAHGAQETSYSGQTTFARAQTAPDELIQLRYDTVDNLVKIGVLTWMYSGKPQAFPNQGYVPDPPRR